MKIIHFLGACSKHELLLYIGKLTGEMGIKTVVVDATSNQNYKYVVPLIGEKMNITEFDSFDVAFGFSQLDDLSKQLIQQDENMNHYELMLVDIDSIEQLSKWETSEQTYLVTNFERFTVRKNIELLENYFSNIGEREVQPIILPFITCNINFTDLEAEVAHLPIIWGEEVIEFWYDERDYEASVQNQYANRISFKGITKQTKKNLLKLTTQISGANEKELNKAIRKATRRR